MESAAERQARQADALRRQVEELTFDIGRILHANTSTLLMVSQTLDSAARALAPELARRKSPPTPHQLAERLGERASSLAGALERFVDAGSEGMRREALPEATWALLGGHVAMLHDYEKRVPVPELRVSTLRAIAASVGDAVRSMGKAPFPRERRRDVLRAASDLERLACYSDVLATKQGVIQMDATLRALRDFITSEVRTHEERRRHDVSTLIREAASQLREFAAAANVELALHRPGEPLEVVGIERDLVRAIANVVHNAIKYSWRREEGRAPWVSIRSFCEESWVVIEVESWGVPVAAEEIEQGLVFELGYRGKWATDRGRLGTGIGLTDALRAAHAHGGELLVASRPARVDPLSPDDREYYKQPFLTKVTLRLPLA